MEKIISFIILCMHVAFFEDEDIKNLHINKIVVEENKAYIYLKEELK